ncbi:hypothetical protein Nepgr_013566 [Nepenthes gracilis]|uniref:Uncharacterized protein n=1 Tax=Nepenthes gracilis TaxID=150966 RepID=A0AAD3SJ31_NEPGR|nr:hypothetical protein Nepgr_013566 [Nepenthes gracilis]
MWERHVLVPESGDGAERSAGRIAQQVGTYRSLKRPQQTLIPEQARLLCTMDHTRALVRVKATLGFLTIATT